MARNWSALAVTVDCATCQFTPSLQGGVVSDPWKR